MVLDAAYAHAYRDLGIDEIRRLLCALRFIVEEKDIETDIVNGW